MLPAVPMLRMHLVCAWIGARQPRELTDTAIVSAAAQVYGVDTDAVALKVKQEFGAKAKARNATKSEPKAATKRKRAA